MYLNQIYFGHGAYGIRAAANTFFEKSLSDLTLEESASPCGSSQVSQQLLSLFAIQNWPRNDRSHVLARMEEATFISAAEHRTAR